MVQYRDYYQILEVERSATAEEVRSAYRRLARKFHPDVNRQADAEERFKEIAEAYEVLRDESKRRRYDALGAHWREGDDFQAPPGFDHAYRDDRSRFHTSWDASQFQGFEFDGFGASGFSDFFELLFGKQKSRKSNRSGRRHGDTEAEIVLQLEDIVGLHRKQVTYRHPDTRKQESLEIKIPRGVREGTRIRVPNRGGEGMGGTVRGDLFLRVHFARHPYLRPDGYDLQVDLPLTPWEAILGGKYTIPTLEGRIRIDLRAGLRPGQKIRMEGLGLYHKDGSRGDLLAVIQIVAPRSITRQERIWLEKLAKEGSFNPRPWESNDRSPRLWSK